jgi:outer membrane protein assembly factor BamB
VRAGTTREVEVNAVGPSSATRGGSLEVAAGLAGSAVIPVAVQTPGGQAAAAPQAQGSGAAGVIFRLMLLLGLGALLLFATQGGLLETFFSALNGPTPSPATPTTAPAPTQPTGPITFGREDWAQPGYGAGHANFSPVDFGLPDRVLGATTLTRGDGDALPSVPLVAGRTAFVAFDNALTAYNLDARQPIWSKAPALPGAIVAQENRVIAGSAGGLIAYEAQNGNVAWQAVIPDIGRTDMVVGPGADGAVVTVIGKESQVWAVDAASGNVLMNYGTEPGLQTFSAPAAGPALVYLRDRTGITALDVQPLSADAVLRWQAPLITEGSATTIGPNTDLSISPPLAGGVHVFVRVRTPEGRTELRSLDAGNGTQAWAAEALPGDSAPAMDENRLYVTGERVVAAYDVNTGKELWRQTLPDVGTRGDILLPEPPLVTPRYIYAVSSIGKIFALDPATGTTAGDLVLANRPVAPAHNPIVANGRMYVVTTDGTLYEIAGR